MAELAALFWLGAALCAVAFVVVLWELAGRLDRFARSRKSPIDPIVEPEDVGKIDDRRSRPRGPDRRRPILRFEKTGNS